MRRVEVEPDCIEILTNKEGIKKMDSLYCKGVTSTKKIRW